MPSDKQWLNISRGVFAATALAAIGVTITAYTYVIDMETAEAENKVMMTYTYNSTNSGTGLKIEMETGLLSQSTVESTVYVTTSNETKPCFDHTIYDADDEKRWMTHAEHICYAVASVNPNNTNLTLKQLFLSDLSIPNITLSKYPSLQTKVNDLKALIETGDAAASLDAIQTASTTQVPVNPTTTTTEATTTTTTTTATTTPGPTNRRRRSSGCHDPKDIDQSKFSLCILKYSTLRTKPTKGSDDAVWTKATHAATDAFALISPEVDTNCFVDGYRDNVYGMLLAFDTIDTFGFWHMMFTIIIFLAMFTFTLSSAAYKPLKAWYSIMAVVFGVFLAGSAWILRTHVGLVVDEVRAAIPGVDCDNQHIKATYANEKGTHAEDMYLVAFILNILVAIMSIATFWMLKEGEYSFLGGFSKSIYG